MVKKNFRREILKNCKLLQNLILETKYINEYNTLSPDGYNLSPTGGIGINHYHSNKTKKKISESLKNRKLTKEIKRKISITLLNKKIKRTKETKRKISKANKHRKYTKKIPKKYEHSTYWFRNAKTNKLCCYFSR